MPEADPRILTVAEVDRIVSRCELADRVLVLLLAYGGLRIGEALPLRRRHIDTTGGRLTIAEAVSELPGGPVIDTPKDHQRRELTVPAFVVQLLRDHLAKLPDDPDAFAFPGRQRHTAHRQQSYHGFRSRFIRAVTAAGLPEVTPHDLRATRPGCRLPRRARRRSPARPLERQRHDPPLRPRHRPTRRRDR